MKKTILYSLVSSGVLLLAGCNETWNPTVGGEGSILPIVNLDSNTISSRSDKQAARSNADEISVDMLHLRLTPTSTGGSAREWTSLSEFNVEEKFSVGTYNFEAYYGDKATEGFDAAYYYGATTVSVRENETTNVSLTASLGNAMLSIKYTEAFANYFSDYSVDIKTLLNNTIKYTRRESRPAYVSPGTVNLAVNVVKQDGTAATINATSFAAVARHHYNVTLDVNNGNVGNAELVISFDDTLDQEDVVINLEDLENIPEPTVKADGFTQGEPVGVVAGSEAENPLVFTVMARGGIASAVLETKSVALKEEGWPERIDLIGTPEATKATMNSLGFKEIGMWHNPDQMAVVDLSGVIPYIKYIEGSTNQSTFTLVVTDKVSQQTQPVTLTVNIEKLSLAITGAEPVMCYANTATINIDYNGADAANRIGVEYKTKFGTFNELKVESATAKGRAMSSYIFNVVGLPDDVEQGEDDVVLRAYAKDANGQKVEKSETDEYTITRTKVPFSLSVDEKDVFALRASGVMAHDSESVAEFAKRAKLEMSTDGGVNYQEYTCTIDGDRIKIEGLKSSTTYTARLKADGLTCRPATFTTEAELSIPNGNLDADVTIDGSESHWENVVFDTWGTNNPMTTSQGGNFGYTRISGTKQTDDAKSGRAAIVSTQGWGSGNTASGSVSTGKCKYIDAGLLHLGASRTTRPEGYSSISGSLTTTDLDCGIEFASRPSSVKFWYKYEAKNAGDHGVATAYVSDASGNVIAEGSVELGAQASYTEKVINFSYNAGAEKAAKIYLCFLSTNVADALKKDKNWITPPSFANVTRGEWYGSRLYVDEITLNY